MDRGVPFVSPPPVARRFLTLVSSVTGLWTVGLLTQASGGQSLDKSGYWVSVAGAAFLASESFGVPAPAVIVGGAVSGLLFGAAKGSP